MLPSPCGMAEDIFGVGKPPPPEEENGDDPPGIAAPEKFGEEPCEYMDAPALPIGPPPVGLLYGDGLPMPDDDGPQLPPPQFLQPIAADSRMAPCSHQKRLDFIILDILSV